MQAKSCIKCNKIKALDQFPVRRDTNKYINTCKVCTSLEAKQYKSKRDKLPRLIVTEKECSICLVVKPVSCFHKNASHADGYVTHCKDCRKLKTKTFYETNKTEIAAKNKERYSKIKDTQEFKDKRKLQRKNNSESINERRKSLRSRDDKYRTYMREYERHKKASDPFFKLKRQIRGRVGDALKYYDIYNTISSVNDMGCDIKFFREYIESLFLDGMTWSLHGRGAGKFHLDHIIPLDFLKDKQDNREAFLIVLNYRNYRPVWEKDNLSKNSDLPNNWKERYDFIKGELQKEGKL